MWNSIQYLYIREQNDCPRDIISSAYYMGKFWHCTFLYELINRIYSLFSLLCIGSLLEGGRWKEGERRTPARFKIYLSPGSTRLISLSTLFIPLRSVSLYPTISLCGGERLGTILDSQVCSIVWKKVCRCCLLA